MFTKSTLKLLVFVQLLACDRVGLHEVIVRAGDGDTDVSPGDTPGDSGSGDNDSRCANTSGLLGHMCSHLSTSIPWSDWTARWTLATGSLGSLAKAWSILRPGDCLELADATFTEPLRPTLSGDPGAHYHLCGKRQGDYQTRPNTTIACHIAGTPGAELHDIENLGHSLSKR
ncbi:MAG: hypothetical protein R3C68_15800 [Myxococcota bacterium]